MTDLDAAKRTLLAELREHSLVIGEVTLSERRQGPVLRRRPSGAAAAGRFPRRRRADRRRRGRGGGDRRRRPGDGGDPARLRGDRGSRGEGLVGFFVRGERKQHGLQRWVEGPVEAGARCLVVEDTVTTGGSTVNAIERIREQGLEVAAVLAVVDRLAGGGEAIEAAARAPYRALVTIDELYPDRPDRG